MRPLATAAVLLSVLARGCGSEQALPVSPPVPVKGRVTYRGKPLAKGTITFEPTDGGREARGTIGPDGTFVLTTNQEGDGALIGVHRVAVSDADPPIRTKKDVHVRVTTDRTEYAVDLK